MLQNCLFINEDNLKEFKEKYNVKIAVIARPDWYLKRKECLHLIVQCEIGIQIRFYLVEEKGVFFLVVYGRFDKIKSTSADINYKLTQATLNFLGIKFIVGTFCVGSLQEEEAGTVYLPNQFVGMGNYNTYFSGQFGFRNTDMYLPMCNSLYEIVRKVARTVNYKVIEDAVYVSFHGYPRIETKAELQYYKEQGWDIVGQTLDVEATLAKSSGCHYVAIAATVDDSRIREKGFEDSLAAINEIEDIILMTRKRTFEIFLKSLPTINEMDEEKCTCMEQGKYTLTQSKLFYYMPFFYDN